MLKHKGTQPIKTERLILRKIKESDYIDVLVYKSNEAVARYVSWDVDTSPEGAKASCRRWEGGYEQDDYYFWAIEFEGKVIGNIDVVEQFDDTAIMGWQIDSTYWNRGIMTEAAKAVFNYLFNEIGFECIEAAHIDKNIGSGRVMQKSGMKEVPYIDSLYYKIGHKNTMHNEKIVFYKLTRRDFNEIQ